MQQHTGIIFKVYLLAKSHPNKEEGFLEFWKLKGNLVRRTRNKRSFNSLSEIPKLIRSELQRADVKWP